MEVVHHLGEGFIFLLLADGPDAAVDQVAEIEVKKLPDLGLVQMITLPIQDPPMNVLDGL